MNTDSHWLIRDLILSTFTALPLFIASTSGAAAPSAGDEELFTRLDANNDGSISAGEVPPDQKRLFARLLRKADGDGNKSLARDEFLASLVPSRPEKTIETKQANSYPQADSVRYLLLTMDTNHNSSIEKNEIPDDMDSVFVAMTERFDANKNGALDRYELSRGFPALGQLALRYVARERIDVSAELKKLQKSQGAAAGRFDEQPSSPMENLRDPRQARQAFARLDGNSDGQLEMTEVPEPFQPQLERFLKRADRDRDNKLSEREFLAGAQRLTRLMQLQQASEKPARDAMPQRDALPAESMPAESESADEP